MACLSFHPMCEFCDKKFVSASTQVADYGLEINVKESLNGLLYLNYNCNFVYLYHCRLILALPNVLSVYLKLRIL